MVTEGCFVSSGGYDETPHDEDTKGGINWGRGCLYVFVSWWFDVQDSKGRAGSGMGILPRI